jgi:AcrR family transcriptional regulator
MEKTATSETPIPCDPEDGPGLKRATGLRGEYKLQTRNRLLRAAQELFNTVGVKETTVDDITRRAGTNRTTFYLHFRDKADLGLELAALLNEEATEMTQRLVKDGAPGRKAVEEWIKGAGEFCRRRRGEIAVASEPLDRDPRYTEAHLRQMEESVREGFAPYLDRFTPGEREIVAAEVMINMIAMRRFLYISIIQGIGFSFCGIEEALVNSWVGLFERHPAPGAKG